MSRFWAAGGSSESESDDSDDSSAASSSGDSSSMGGGGGAGGAGGANRNETRWLAMSDSESSDDAVRIVKSGKERALESFQKRIKHFYVPL